MADNVDQGNKVDGAHGGGSDTRPDLTRDEQRGLGLQVSTRHMYPIFIYLIFYLLSQEA